MKAFVWMLAIFTSLSSIAVAQDTSFDPDEIPNFGRELLHFEIPMEDNNFLLGKHIAIQPDLSRIYVGSGAVGIVLILDNKGNLLGQVDVMYEAPITDIAIGFDDNLYIVQFGDIYIFDPDGTRIHHIESDFSAGVNYDRIVPLPDKTMYALDVFSDKDRLYHLSLEGELLSETEAGFFSTITGSSNGIFDEIKLGQDGYLYYFNDEDKQMVQLDEELNVVNTYTNLITEAQDPQRSAMLIDADGKVLLGNNGGVEIYGEKEALVHTLKLATEYEFVYDMAFADDGVLAVVQFSSVTLLQYGLQDETED